MKPLIATNKTLISLGIFLIRATFGLILFIGGSGKALQWFNGFGFEMTAHYYGMQGISRFWTYVSVYTEFIGGALLIIGFLTRPVAFAILINMTVAFILTLPNGFVAQNGASVPFTFLIAALVILLTGPMQLSIDWLIFSRKNDRLTH